MTDMETRARALDAKIVGELDPETRWFHIRDFARSEQRRALEGFREWLDQLRQEVLYVHADHSGCALLRDSIRELDRRLKELQDAKP